MTDCPSCAAAKAQPNAATFCTDCQSCLARALAVTGAHLESQDKGAITEQYRTALDKCFGAEWEKGHALVKEWGALVRRSRTTNVQRVPPGRL